MWENRDFSCQIGNKKTFVTFFLTHVFSTNRPLAILLLPLKIILNTQQEKILTRKFPYGSHTDTIIIVTLMWFFLNIPIDSRSVCRCTFILSQDMYCHWQKHYIHSRHTKAHTYQSTHARNLEFLTCTFYYTLHHVHISKSQKCFAKWTQDG